MRDIVLLGIVVAALPFACRHTWIGVLLWTWISIMNPHKLAWGFAMSMPFAAMAAGATAISLFVTKDKVRLPSNPAIVALILLTLWMVVTTIFAIHPDESWLDLKRTFKIQAMTLVALAALRERRHIELFIWVNTGTQPGRQSALELDRSGNTRNDELRMLAEKAVSMRPVRKGIRKSRHRAYI